MIFDFQEMYNKIRNSIAERVNIKKKIKKYTIKLEKQLGKEMPSKKIEHLRYI